MGAIVGRAPELQSAVNQEFASGAVRCGRRIGGSRSHSRAGVAYPGIAMTPIPVTTSSKSRHGVVNGQCVVRYDNETGKGDHRHLGEVERPYRFTTPEQLVADFFSEIERWRHENGDS